MSICWFVVSCIGVETLALFRSPSLVSVHHRHSEYLWTECWLHHSWCQMPSSPYFEMWVALWRFFGFSKKRKISRMTAIWKMLSWLLIGPLWLLPVSHYQWSLCTPTPGIFCLLHYTSLGFCPFICDLNRLIRVPHLLYDKYFVPSLVHYSFLSWTMEKLPPYFLRGWRIHTQELSFRQLHISVCFFTKRTVFFWKTACLPSSLCTTSFLLPFFSPFVSSTGICWTPSMYHVLC